MQQAIKEKMIQVCNEKIAKKGDQVGLSFYAFLQIKMMIQKL
jgi:hypothetical protein